MSIHLDKLKAYDVESGGDEERMGDAGHAQKRLTLGDDGERTSSNASEALQRSARTTQILRRHPLLLVVPTLVLLIIIALCVFGVTYATNIRIETQQDLAKVEARDAADALRLQLSVASSAALTLATFVQVDPDWNSLEKKFEPICKEIFRQANETSSYELAELLYLPFGKAAANYAPPEIYRGPVRTDIFGEEVIDRAKPFLTLELGTMTINGPFRLSTGGRTAILARYPVYIKNVSRDEDWNNPFNMTGPTGCDELCYNDKTNTKFWGFTTAFFYADSLVAGEDERLLQLADAGYEYRLSKSNNITHPAPHDEQDVIVQSKGWSLDHEPTATVDVQISGAAWCLAVHDHEIDGIKDMRDGLIAMIVICAFLFSGLLLMLLVSNKRASILLDEQLVTNNTLEKTNAHLTKTKRVLEEEKQQREALLGRQYDLISCFEGSKDKGGYRKNSPGSKISSSVEDKQMATLEQIAALRRTMEMERRQHVLSPNDDIRFFEILGEGTFGKVHRGSWRSTEVAIKTILLPANMSGAEKREKMVIWEAAISSILLHPNIVQMYTYSIKPVREQDKKSTCQKSFDDSMPGLGLGSAVQICGGTEDGIKHGSSTVQGSSDKITEGGAIHSFEVSLVLEYCDKGSLRSALDQGAFMTDTGLNYPGILDSAIDVARAMLHLHMNNILHMDLKAGNILLSSCGPMEGRGVTCKASDFGLAVRMEQAETHMSGCFQGTLTHMAPETLLTGRVSKAADVYAFGILLWELFTGGQPYKGIPKALLGHKIVAQHQRPSLPFYMPQGYKDLIQSCWVHNPQKRPTFAEILERLQALRNSLPCQTEPLGPINRPLPKVATQAIKPSRSLLGISEHSSCSHESAAANSFGRVEHVSQGRLSHSAHSRELQSADHSAPGPWRSAEDISRSTARRFSRSSEAAVRTEGIKSCWNTDGSRGRKMVRFHSAGPRDREGRGSPEVGGSHSESRNGQCDLTGVEEEQVHHAQGEDGADAAGGREAGGRSLLRRCSSLPSLQVRGAGEEETSTSEQTSNSQMLSGGTHSGSNSHGSHGNFLSSEELVSRQGAGLSSSSAQGDHDGMWLPFAPQHLSGPADLQQMAKSSGVTQHERWHKKDPFCLSPRKRQPAQAQPQQGPLMCDGHRW